MRHQMSVVCGKLIGYMDDGFELRVYRFLFKVFLCPKTDCSLAVLILIRFDQV
jgi:hypothetical protein